MKNIQRFAPFFCIFTFLSTVFSQKNHDLDCGFDALRQPSEQAKINLFEQELEQFFFKKKDVETAAPVPFIVPVVVHIIHNNGAENIPDAQVLAAIDHLNVAFAAGGFFAQNGATVNTQIQFCLAKRDPDGNATSGITRDQSPFTEMVMETEDLSLKNINRWKTTDYVNIWVVKSITSLSAGAGVVGYAYFPSSHGGAEDGMVCEAAYFGKSPSEDAVLIHEMGHYFGLYHTFEGGCKNDNCAINGDRVCDTPPDQARHTDCVYNSCSTDVAAGSPFTSDVDDMTENFLDYSPFSCYSSFTDGQAARMQAAISVARSSLLSSLGCSDPCTMPVEASFSAVPNPVLAGQSVVFSNNSTGATNFEWSEGGAVFSNNINETRLFNTVGDHLILLKSTNQDPNCGDTAMISIKVLCPLSVDFSSSNLNPAVDEAVDFTSTATGVATDFEWSANGIPVGTSANLTFSFPNSGLIAVNLVASGPFCSAEKTVWVNVKPACGVVPEPMIANFTSPNKGFLTQDIEAFGGGFILHCGSQNEKPMVTLFDATSNIVWHKELNVAGAFYGIEPLPDGSGWLLNGQLGTGANGNIAAGDILICKIDFNGNFIWAKRLTIGNKFKYIGDGSSVVAANPDGSFGLLTEGNSGGNYFSKLSSNGLLLWSKKLATNGAPNGCDGVRGAVDGSGDFLLEFTPGASSAPFAVARVSQNGDIIWAKQYQFPAESPGGLTYVNFSTHEGEGGFSFASTRFPQSTGFGQGNKWITRCRPDGSVKWAKKYVNSGGIVTNYAFYSHPPGDKGWLVMDSKTNADFSFLNNYVEHISEEGEVIWLRKFGGQGLFGETTIHMALDKGRIRFVREKANNSDFQLMTLPDDGSLPIACLPDVPLSETSEPLQAEVSNVNLTATTSFAITALDFTPTFLTDELTRTLTCDFVFPCPEICDNQLDDDEDGYVDCFDTDCDCIDTDTACTIAPLLSEISMKLSWESADSLVSPTAIPLVANLNPQTDDIPEIIIMGKSSSGQFFRNALIFSGDGSNKNSPKTLEIASGSLFNDSPSNMAIADLDADGIPELLAIGSSGNLSIYKNYDPAAAVPMTLWVVSAQKTTGWFGQMNIADFDQDGVPEIFIGKEIFRLDLTNPATPVLSKVLTGSADAGQGSSFSSTAADLLSVADCNGDPDCDGLEIAAGGSIYSIDLSVTDGDGLEIKEKRNLNQLDPAPKVHHDGVTTVADIDLDGKPELIIGSWINAQPHGVTAWNKDGLLRFFPLTNPGFTMKSGGMPLIANVFDDTKAGFAVDFPEIIVVGTNKLFCLNEHAASLDPLKPYWWSLPIFDLSAYTSPTAFDFNGDGILEIAYRDEHDLRILYGGAAPFPPGVDANRTWAALTCGSVTFQEYPVVADIDADGQAEIIVAGMQNEFQASMGQGLRRLRVFESAGQPWMPARPIWNQYNYFGVNINDDLTVPKTQQKHWLEMGGIGSGKRPFNTHLAQVASLNPLTINKLKVPDATVAVDSVRCKLDSLDVFLKIENLGSADFLPKIALSFYKTNPETTAAPLLFPPVFLDKQLEKDSLLFVKLTIPATYNQPVFVAVNDDGSAPRPLNLTLDTISTGQPECHLENNIAQFIFQNSTPPINLGPDILLCENSVVKLSAGPLFKKYRWPDGSTDSTFTAFGAGKYWVDAFDACGFRQTDTILIQLNTAATLGLPAFVKICAGGASEIAANPIFDQYKWSPASVLSCADCAKPDFIGTSPVMVSVTARSGNCFVTDSVQVDFFQKPVVEIAATDGDCGNPASLTATATGIAPFSFNWSNNQPGASITTTQSGSYTVTTTDGNGCTGQNTASVSVTNSLSVTAVSQDPKCAGNTDGFIQLTATGGGGNIQFLWSNGASGANLTDLASGNFSVTATDASGCTFTQNFTLTEPPLLVFSENHDDASCPSANDGSASVSISGGQAGFSIKWVNGATTTTITGLSAGNYPFTVTDAAGCTATGFVEIKAIDTQPPVVKLKPATVPIDANGKASMTLALLNDGSTDNCGITGWTIEPPFFECNQLGMQTVTLTATDASGNTASQTVLVEIIDNKPPVLTCPTDKTVWWCSPIVAYAAPVAIDNCLGAGGQFALESGLPSGSTFPIGQTINQWSYTDAGGNVGTCAFTVTVFEKPLVDFVGQQPLCNGDCTGSLTAAPTGGAGPFQFLWANGQATATATMLCAGLHTATVTDGGGCQTVETIPLGEPPLLTVNFLSKTDDIGGAGLGAISLAVSGGVPPYVMTWEKDGQFFSSNLSLTGLTTGNYAFKLVDANGCLFFFPPIFIDNLVATTEPDWANGMTLRPNPTDGKSELVFDKKIEGALVVEVFDAAGRLIEVLRFAGGGLSFPIDLRERAAGFYQLKITTGGRVVSRKLVRI